MMLKDVWLWLKVGGCFLYIATDMGATRTCSVCREAGHDRRTCPVIKPLDTPHENRNDKPVLDHDDPGIIRGCKIFHDMMNQPGYVDSCRHTLRGMYERKLDDKIRKYLLTNNTSVSFAEVKDRVRMCDPEYTECLLWFQPSIEACMEIRERLIDNPNINQIIITAECGSGKSAIINCYMYSDACLAACTTPSEYRPIENKFIFTGYSSTDYCKDMEGNIDFSNQIYHRNTIHKLIDYIYDDPSRLCNADFIIDEARLVVQVKQTIHKLFVSLGIDNPLSMKQYNIRVIYIDATPDSLLLLHNSLSDDNTSAKITVKSGENYKGFNYFNNNDNIYLNNIFEDNNIRNSHGLDFIMNKIINICKNEKRNVVMRIKDDKMRVDIESILIPNGIKVGVNMHDMTRWSSDLSTDFNKAINTNYITNGMVFILSHKYPCSKRLTLGENIGMLYDSKNAKNPDEAYDTSTTQGLVPRFFGYYDMSNVNVEIYCNMIHFERQLYTNQQGLLPVGYKSGVVKNNKLKVDIYGQKLAGKDEINDVLIAQQNIRKGECYQGNIYKVEMLRLYPEKHAEFYDNMYNGVIHDHFELFDDLEDAQKRVVSIRGRKWKFNNETIRDFKELENTKHHSTFEECRLYRCRRHIDEPIQYMLKWQRLFNV